ncbi:hypothetical protein NLG97_g1049 [Lecanicillium saksenae]|uniref:Uncharacterized protein n=1 Tax=Lecanicillium saksenae TaxID=468837 RepID=A0ACC1R4V0_9HYPO|nr:hypothetical protein NLG97_g1049 [Lecanicillium saksenae]
MPLIGNMRRLHFNIHQIVNSNNKKVKVNAYIVVLSCDYTAISTANFPTSDFLITFDGFSPLWHSNPDSKKPPATRATFIPGTPRRHDSLKYSTPVQNDDMECLASELLAKAGFKLVRSEELQALWAGYGFIYAIEAEAMQSADVDARPSSSYEHLSDADGKIHLVLKIISPPKTKSDEGHLRKLFSYEVEQYFYQNIAPSLPQGVAVAECLASTHGSALGGGGGPGITATLMSDLRLQFPIAGEKRSFLSPIQVHSAIKWLAEFHGSSWTLQDAHTMNGLLLPPIAEFEARESNPSLSPRSIWLNGGYTYLATRQAEYASLASNSASEWSAAFCSSKGAASVAEKVAKFLTPRGRPFETFIHGDVKSENLFANESGDSVAFFDFQYVGIGLGVSDLAKLFTCSVPLRMLVGRQDTLSREIPMQQEELGLLSQYHQLLTQHDTENRAKYDFTELQRHWETALVDWCRFQASWGFWGNTRWLQGRVRSILGDSNWTSWLEDQQ